MYIICIDSCLDRHNMTDKEHKKLKNQLRSLKKLGFPPDKSILTLLSKTLINNKRLTNKKNLSMI